VTQLNGRYLSFSDNKHYAKLKKRQRTDVTNTYGADGELTSEADGKGNLTTLVYTGYDQLYQVEFPNPSNGTVSSTTDYEQYTYDNNGNVVQDRRRDGVVVSYAYDAVNNPLSGPNGASYGYDVLNRLVSASLNGQSLSFVYDGLGRQTQQTSPLGTVVRQFDADGDRTSLTFPDGFAFSYSYDAADELTSITDSAGATIETIAYDNFGRRGTVTRPSVATTSYGYDSALRLNSLAHTFADTSKNETFTLAYSPASQLTSQTSSNSLYDWSMPAAGSLAYTTNGQNKYVTVGGNTFSYDARGDLSGDGVNTYGYDESNELTSLNASTTLTYDALGRLYQTQGSATTQFLYESGQIIAEYSGGSVLRRYAPGDQTSEAAAWYEGAGIANRRWLIPDPHGSNIAVANAAGTTVGINTYDPYGLAGPTNIGRFQFDGEPWVPETGLYQMGARAYSPTLGRFMQLDPSGYSDGLNFYTYAHNDPINEWDPLGLAACRGGDIFVDGGDSPVTSGLVCDEVPDQGGVSLTFGGGFGSGLIGGLGNLVKGWVLALNSKTVDARKKSDTR